MITVFLKGRFYILMALSAEAFGTNDIVKADISFDFASREMFYGLGINREPVVIPDWSLTFFDWVSCGFMAYIDTTDWGARKHRGSPGYGDRVEPYLGINECGFMDTTLCVSLEWRPVSFLTIAPYAAYCEYVFDRHLRDLLLCHTTTSCLQYTILLGEYQRRNEKAPPKKERFAVK